MVMNNTNNIFDPNRGVNWVAARKAYIDDGFLPTSKWIALETFGGKIRMETTDPEDFKRHELYEHPEITIIRQYLKETETWVKEDPFPEKEEVRPVITSEDIIGFIVDGLGISLEAWQEDVVRARFEDRTAKVKLDGKSS
ncbi:hypothetical protein PP914_gp167 [Arthrobacter phage Qui]|uniref:Uncharacterized protein n=1 Tax=Arthrobacter phage Qui TaxID=2603260 RepID=A0A5B8WKP7_9CAUD|nr:hypothetical protein PP914_gp167 [Arthrobacter phage Qui]QED11655.1 hypothetical protein SEA_QUI_167 [Arthrobacter phage Qui]QOC56486.1 hypothetical protein SEA_PAELLA_167 [Arthrobacter phage Paella]